MFCRKTGKKLNLADEINAPGDLFGRPYVFAEKPDLKLNLVEGVISLGIYLFVWVSVFCRQKNGFKTKSLRRSKFVGRFIYLSSLVFFSKNRFWN